MQDLKNQFTETSDQFEKLQKAQLLQFDMLKKEQLQQITDLEKLH